MSKPESLQRGPSKNSCTYKEHISEWGDWDLARSQALKHIKSSFPSDVGTLSENSKNSHRYIFIVFFHYNLPPLHALHP